MSKKTEIPTNNRGDTATSQGIKGFLNTYAKFMGQYSPILIDNSLHINPKSKLNRFSSTGCLSSGEGDHSFAMNMILSNLTYHVGGDREQQKPMNVATALSNALVHLEQITPTNDIITQHINEGKYFFTQAKNIFLKASTTGNMAQTDIFQTIIKNNFANDSQLQLNAFIFLRQQVIPLIIALENQHKGMAYKKQQGVPARHSEGSEIRKSTLYLLDLEKKATNQIATNLENNMSEMVQNFLNTTDYRPVETGKGNKVTPKRKDIDNLYLQNFEAGIRTNYFGNLKMNISFVLNKFIRQCPNITQSMNKELFSKFVAEFIKQTLETKFQIKEPNKTLTKKNDDDFVPKGFKPQPVYGKAWIEIFDQKLPTGPTKYYEQKQEVIDLEQYKNNTTYRTAILSKYLNETILSEVDPELHKKQTQKKLNQSIADFEQLSFNVQSEYDFQKILTILTEKMTPAFEFINQQYTLLDTKQAQGILTHITEIYSTLNSQSPKNNLPQELLYDCSIYLDKIIFYEGLDENQKDQARKTKHSINTFLHQANIDPASRHSNALINYNDNNYQYSKEDLKQIGQRVLEDSPNTEIKFVGVHTANLLQNNPFDTGEILPEKNEKTVGILNCYNKHYVPFIISCSEDGDYKAEYNDHIIKEQTKAIAYFKSLNIESNNIINHHSSPSQEQDIQYEHLNSGICALQGMRQLIGEQIDKAKTSQELKKEYAIKLLQEALNTENKTPEEQLKNFGNLNIQHVSFNSLMPLIKSLEKDDLSNFMFCKNQYELHQFGLEQNLSQEVSEKPENPLESKTQPLKRPRPESSEQTEEQSIKPQAKSQKTKKVSYVEKIKNERSKSQKKSYDPNLS
ncbi:MAG: hypothetical protein DGJ47_000770 [Rickettsiaceae bacterium]